MCGSIWCNACLEFLIVDITKCWVIMTDQVLKDEFRSLLASSSCKNFARYAFRILCQKFRTADISENGDKSWMVMRKPTQRVKQDPHAERDGGRLPRGQPRHQPHHLQWLLCNATPWVPYKVNCLFLSVLSSNFDQCDFNWKGPVKNVTCKHTPL